LRSGYTFSGWFTASTGGTQVTDGSYTPASPYGGVTIYARWTVTPNSTVTFKANGGIGSDASQSTNVDANLNSNTFTYSGYNFVGWNTLANGNGTNYANNASYNFAANLTLFAKWTAKSTRTLTFAVLTYSINIGDTVTATAALSVGSGSITYSAGISTACNVDPTTGLVTVTNGVGTCSISGSTPEDATYAAITSMAPVVITVGFNTPAKPIITNVSALTNTMKLTVTQSDLNTNGINNYKYSIDGTTYISIGSISSPLSITGLTPGIYSVRIKAVNPAGESTPSDALTVIVITGPTITVNVPVENPTPVYNGPSAAEIEAGKKTAVEKALADKAAADKAAADKAAAEKALADKAAADKAAADKAAADKAALEKALADKAAADKAALEKALADKTAADKAAAEKAALEKALSEKTAGEKAAVEKALADKAALEKALADKAACEKELADKAAADKAALEKALADKATAEKEALEKALADKAAADKAALEKATADKAAADKAALEKATADKAAADKAALEKAAADKAALEKALADKATAEKEALEKALADKAAADKAALEKAAADNLAACILGKSATLVTAKKKTMRLYAQICFIPEMMKPIEQDMTQISKVIAQIKSKKIKSITLLSFADEKIGVNFKSAAKTRAKMISEIIKRSVPKLKVSYALFGSSTKKNIASQGRVVITAN